MNVSNGIPFSDWLTYSAAKSDLVSSGAGTGVDGLEAGARTPNPM